MKKTIFYLALATMFTCCGCMKNSGVTNDKVASKADLSPDKIGYYSTLKLPIDKNNTTIVAMCDTSVSTNNESVVIEELRRRTGINLQILEVPRASLKEKAKVMMASRTNLPDIFQGLDINEFGVQGAFESIEQHINELPNLKEIFYTNEKENGTENIINRLKASDGNLYQFPRFSVSRLINTGVLYRKDIFDKHNIPLWNGPDEFYQVLKKLKEHYPNSYPYASKLGMGIINRWGESWGIGGSGFKPYYDEETKSWNHSVTDEKFKDMIEFLKKLYDEKLIDPEFLTMNESLWTAKMTQADKAFVTLDWIGRMDMFSEQSAETIPDYNLRFGPPIGPTGNYVTLPQSGGGPGVKKSENSLIALKLLDYLISPSGAQLMSMGIEGVTYEMDENGFAKYYGFDDVPGIDALEEKYGLYISGLYRRFDKRSSYFNFTEKEQEAQEMVQNAVNNIEPPDPELIFNSQELEVLEKYQASLTKAAEEFVMQYILGTIPTGIAWNNWLAKAKQLGTEEILNQYRSAQERYDQRMGG